MKIVIAHLYYDLMNLYGESGNVRALIKYLEREGIDVVVEFISIGDKFDFTKYDLVYIGSGTEENQILALKDLMKHKDALKCAIENDLFVLATGNSYELFGKSLTLLDGTKIACLNIFDYSAKETDFRIIDEAVFKSSKVSGPLIGFQNHKSVIKDNKKPMFSVITGTGSYPGSDGEGFNYKNFYGTYLIGPLLIRNPHFTKYLILKLIGKEINSDTDFLEEKAYDAYLKNFVKESV